MGHKVKNIVMEARLSKIKMDRNCQCAYFTLTGIAEREREREMIK